MSQTLATANPELGWVDDEFAAQPRPDVAQLGAMLREKTPANDAAPNSSPMVTVVTVVFNAIKNDRQEQLIQSLDSVQAQVGTTIEHVVIDGASPDGTVELIQNYHNKNIPIRWLSAPDKGIYDAMNRGLYLARGKYVIFLNSDDFYSNPGGLADSVRRLEETGCDFSYSPITVLSETTGEPIDHPSSHVDVNIFFMEMSFCHQSIMLKREAMMGIRGFDLRYRSGADYDSILRLIFSGHRACRVDTNFVSFRLGGFSFVNVGKSQQEVGTIYSRLYKKYLNVEFTPEEGMAIYVKKQAPRILKQRQLAFARAAFGDAIQREEALWQTNGLDDDLQTLMNRLNNLSRQRGVFAAMLDTAKLLLTTPVKFTKFLHLYAKIKKSEGKANAKIKACNQLIAQLKAKREGAIADTTLKAIDKICISAHDFWYTNGLYAVEAWGAWTGQTVSVFFTLPEEFKNQALTAKVNLGAYVIPESPKRVIDIMVNDEKLTRIEIDNFMPQEHSFEIPAKMTAAGKLDIDFIAEKAFVPKELGFNEDSRSLAMTFQQFSVQKQKRKRKATR